MASFCRTRTSRSYQPGFADDSNASTYWWRGSVESAAEWQIIFKTTDERYDELEAHLRSRHDYDVPEILRTPVVAGNPAYLSWLTAETSS